MPQIDVNYWAVLVSALAAMAIGAAWYGAFAQTWLKLIGKKQADLMKGRNQGYAIAFVLALLTAFVLAHFVGYAQAETWSEGAVTGFWAWLGFVAATMGVQYLFEQRPRDLYLVNAGHQLVNLVVMGAILGAWR